MVAVVVGGPAELLEGGRLQPVLAVLDGQLQRPLLVGEGGRVVAQRDQDPAPVQPGAGLQGRVAGLGGGGHGLAEQAFGVAVGVGPDGVGGRRHPGPGRGRPVAGGGGVAGGRLRPVGQHAGQAAVAGDPGRPRAGRVQDLADQVVGEPVAGAGVVLDQQAGGQGTLGPGGRVLDRQVEQAGHDLQVEGGPDHHRRPQQRLDLGAGPPGLVCTASRSDAGTAARSRPPSAAARRLSTVNRVWPLARSSTGPARSATPKRRASSATAAAGSGPSSSTGPAPARAASASAPSSARTPASTSTRSPCRRRRRKWRSSRVEAPARWRSSTASSSGCWAARPRTKAATASNDRRRCSSAGARS